MASQAVCRLRPTDAPTIVERARSAHMAPLEGDGAIPAIRVAARRTLTAMPTSAQRSVFDFADRRKNGEARDRFLEQVDIALEGLAGKRVLEIGTGGTADLLRRLQDRLTSPKR